MKKNSLPFVVGLIWRRKKGLLFFYPFFPSSFFLFLFLSFSSSCSFLTSYGQTKVVSERLIYEAHKKFGIDARVYRPCAISGAVGPSGFSNKRDFTNLLLK